MSPFEVKTARKWPCNHMISLSSNNAAREHLLKFENLVTNNDLVRFMLPIPRGVGKSSALFFSDNHDRDLLYIVWLLKMSSPIKLPIYWANMVIPQTMVVELSMTNVQPLVVAGVGIEHVSLVRDLCRQASVSPRKLLVMAHPDVSLPNSVTGEHFFQQDEVDLAALPWETLGSMVLRGYMRNEWIENKFTREPTPSNEVKHVRNSSGLSSS